MLPHVRMRNRSASNDSTHHVQCIGIDKRPLATITVILMTNSSVHVLIECRLLTEFFVADIAFNWMLLLDMTVELLSEFEHPIAALTVVPVFLLLVFNTVFFPAEAFVAIIAFIVVGMQGTAGNVIVIAIGIERSTAAVRHCSGRDVYEGADIVDRR